MIAPYVAKQLFNFIENNEVLDSEIDINRVLIKIKIRLALRLRVFAS